MRKDRRIPTLVSLTRGGAIVGVSKQRMSRLVAEGRLVGVKVGRQTLLVRGEVIAFAKARREGGVEAWRRKPRVIPALVSPAGAGRMLNLTPRWVRELYASGDLPGAEVGKDIVFREEVIRREALARRAVREADG